MISSIYLAGLFDGEGNVEIHITSGGSWVSEISIANTFESLLYQLEGAFGGKVRCVNRHCKVATDRSWKLLYRWHVGGQAALPILRTIHPFLIVKREQVELLTEFLETLSPGKGNRLTDVQFDRVSIIHDRIKELNRRGRRPSVEPVEVVADETEMAIRLLEERLLQEK
jgi:hypothetical protein